MPTTTRLGIPYPTDSDLITNGDEAIQAIADAFDAQGLVYLIGTIASRPAASAVAGRIYIATDTLGLSVSTGSVWIDTWLAPDGTITFAKLHANLQALIPPIGTLLPYSGNVAPNSSWLIADGAAVSRTTYSTLFNLYNALSPALPYGTGDGSTTFNLPDLRGRSLVGKGTHTDVDAIAENEGNAVANRSPKHDHTVGAVGGHSHGGGTGFIGVNHTHALNYFGVAYTTGGTFHNLFTPDGGSNPSSTGNDNTNHWHTIAADGGHSHTVGLAGRPNDTPAFLIGQYIVRAL